MIPDHPVIRAVERNGYPTPVKKSVVYCLDCNAELADEDKVFDYDSDPLCENCFRDRLMADMNAADLAERLGFIVKDACDWAAEREEE